MFATFFQVAIGGALGAVLRLGVGAVVVFPFGTLAVNVIGSFAMGVLFVALLDKGAERWIPFLMTGVLGGFTTFSAFSLDTLKLYDDGRIGAAAGYVVTSVLLSLAAIFVGVILMRSLQT